MSGVEVLSKRLIFTGLFQTLDTVTMFNVFQKGFTNCSCVNCYLRQCESSGSDESTSQTGVCSVDLKLSMLESHHQLHGQVDVSEYATNGASVKRIKGAFADPQCSCGKCTMPLPVLAQCCKSFWGLPKQQQDAILWSLQSEGSGGSRKWSIEGQ